MTGAYRSWRRQWGLARELWSAGESGPSRLTAILTEHCHLRCDFCRLWEDPQHGAETAEWIKLFQKNPNLRWVNLSGGEIFARESLQTLLQEMIQALPHLALLDFPTAGQRPDRVEEVVRDLLASSLPRLVVTISLDGGPELHDELRGVPGAFERALKTYLRLRSLQSGRFATRIGCTLTARADQQVESLTRVLGERLPGFRPREVHYNLAHHSSHYYRNQPFQELPDQSALRILEKARLRPDPLSWVEWVYGRLARESLREGFPRVGCESLRHTLFVSPDLTAYPCSIWDQPLGNLKDYDYSLLRLVQSSQSRAARKKIDEQACPGCFSPCEAVPAMLAHPLRATLAALQRSAS